MTTTQQGTAIGAGTGAGKSNYYKVRKTQRSEGIIYPDVINIDEGNEDLFTRYWENNHWIYTPTHNPDNTNLFRRVKGKDGRWDYILIINRNEVEAGQDKTLSPEDEGLEKARKEIQDELKIIRDQRTQ